MRRSQRVAALIAGGVLTMALSSCAGSGADLLRSLANEDQDAAEESTPAATIADTTTAATSGTSNDTGASFADGVLETAEITIKITEARKILQGEPGNEYGDVPVLGFWFDVTNKSDEEITTMDPWISTFDAVQDNDPNFVNELEVGSSPDSELSRNGLLKIKPGGTVSYAFAYELDDETTPVELIAKLHGDKVGSQTYAVE